MRTLSPSFTAISLFDIYVFYWVLAALFPVFCHRCIEVSIPDQSWRYATLKHVSAPRARGNPFLDKKYLSHYPSVNRACKSYFVHASKAHFPMLSCCLINLFPGHSTIEIIIDVDEEYWLSKNCVFRLVFYFDFG